VEVLSPENRRLKHENDALQMESARKASVAAQLALAEEEVGLLTRKNADLQKALDAKTTLISATPAPLSQEVQDQLSLLAAQQMAEASAKLMVESLWPTTHTEPVLREVAITQLLRQCLQKGPMLQTEICKLIMLRLVALQSSMKEVDYVNGPISVI